MGSVLKIATEPSGDWCEFISNAQVDGIGLKEIDRYKFNTAFESYTTGSFSSAFNGFLELSEKGSPISQYMMGVMYLKGQGVLQDFLRAHMWFNIASSRGHKTANVQLVKLTKELNVDQVATAQKLAQNCVASNFKDV